MFNVRDLHGVQQLTHAKQRQYKILTNVKAKKIDIKCTNQMSLQELVSLNESNKNNCKVNVKIR